MTKTVIIGAGISGLYAGFRLAEHGKEVTLIEKSSTVGGMAKSMPYKDYILDFGPHKIYSVLPGIMDEYQRFMDGKLLSVEKRNSIFLEGKRIQFPLNPMKAPFQINPLSILTCGIGFGIATLKQLVAPRKIKTYEDYFIAGFGTAGYKLIFRDLAWKVWGDPKTLTEELARKRVPVPNVFTLLTSFVKKNPNLSAKNFLYPKHGFGELADTLARKIKKQRGTITLESQPTKIAVKNGKVSSISYRGKKSTTIKNPEQVISTIYVPDLLGIITPKPPKKVVQAAARLRFRGLALVFIFLDQEHALDDHWVFFPEKKYVFNRVSEIKRFGAGVAPAGKTYIIAEVTLDLDDPLFNDDAALTKRVLADLNKTKLINPAKITETLVKKARRIYPVYDLDYRENLITVLKYLDTISNLYTIGRPGLFNYNNTDHCIDTGMKLTDVILNGGGTKEWIEARKTFNKYSIID